MGRHTVWLPETISQYVESRIAEAGYGDIDAYFYDLIDNDRQQREKAIDELRDMIAKAEAGGLSDKTVDDIFETAVHKARQTGRISD